MSNGDLEQLVLQHVSRPNYKPVKPKVIAKQLRLSDEQKLELKRTIKRLVKRGEIKYGSNHLVEPRKGGSRKHEIVGKFHRAMAGYGFVRPQGVRSRDKGEDIYIPAKNTSDAANGDTVRIQVGPKKRRGSELRVSGEIVDIIKRAKHQFVGSYFENEKAGFVQVDGNVFAQPVYVGDPGAKNAGPDDKVVIEMVRFPTAKRQGEAVISEVLGKYGDTGLDTKLIMREFGLPDEFPEHVLDAAREEADEFDESLGDRTDLTESTIITIDPHDARDFDDAISLEQLENGHWRLGVHIADVSHFVKYRSVLDVEARDRATSVYLPDRVIPMLPEVISNNLASLQPDRVRYAETAFIEFTENGAPVATDLHLSAIKSKRRFTYEEVDDYLESPARWKEKLDPSVFDLLGRMHKLAMILRNRRLDSGSIELSMPEVKLKLDRKGEVVGAKISKHTESHQIIEEFMLAANIAVAEKLKGLELFFLRRVHEAPDPRRLKSLTSFVRELGFDVESLESRFEIKRILAEVADKPESHAVNFAVLRSMAKAVYGPQDDGHYALSAPCYCHFTSPIRRYPDLTIHRMVRSLVNGRSPRSDFEALATEGEHCSEREQRAEQAERELIKLKLLLYLNKRIGQKMDAVITGVQDFGLFAQGIDLPAEGLIHINSLEDDNYLFDAASHSLVGRRKDHSYRLGDLIEVEIASVDIDRRELDFRLVRKKKSAKPGVRKESNPSTKKKKKYGKKNKKPKRKKGRRKPG